MSRVRQLRKSPRPAARHKVTMQQRLDVTRTAVCFTLNVGDGGFCVGIVRVLAPGTEVEGTIDMNGTAVPFTGTIAWAKAGDARLGERGRMGVLFTKMAGERAEATGDETTQELPLSELRR